MGSLSQTPESGRGVGEAWGGVVDGAANQHSMQASESIPAPGLGEEERREHEMCSMYCDACEKCKTGFSHHTASECECAGNRQPPAFAFSHVNVSASGHCYLLSYSHTCTCIFTCYLTSLTSAFAILFYPFYVRSAYSSHSQPLQAPRHRVVEFRPDFPGIDCCAHRHLARRIARLSPYQALPTQACQQTTVNITNVLNRRVHQQK